MTVKEFYEYLVSLGAENFTVRADEWGNITEEDIAVDFKDGYVSI